MKLLARFLVITLAILAAACGDSSDDSQPIEPVATTLVTFGDASTTAAPVPSQLTVITSAAQLQTLATGRFPVPASLANFNFSTGSVVYMEGLGDQDPTSVIRLVQVTRNSGEDFFTLESCASTLRVTGTHRPYALYTTSKVINFVAFQLQSGTYDCPSTKRIAATLVSAGSYVNLTNPPVPPPVIRNQTDFDIARAQGLIPASYPMPDFNQTNLLYFDDGSSHVGPYLRLIVLVQEGDGSRNALLEYCDVINNTSHFPVVAYSVYAVPAFTGGVQETVIIRNVTNGGEVCVTAP